MIATSARSGRVATSRFAGALTAAAAEAPTGASQSSEVDVPDRPLGPSPVLRVMSPPVVADDRKAQSAPSDVLDLRCPPPVRGQGLPQPGVGPAEAGRPGAGRSAQGVEGGQLRRGLALEDRLGEQL